MRRILNWLVKEEEEEEILFFQFISYAYPRTESNHFALVILNDASRLFPRTFIDMRSPWRCSIPCNLMNVSNCIFARLTYETSCFRIILSSDYIIFLISICFNKDISIFNELNMYTQALSKICFMRKLCRNLYNRFGEPQGKVVEASIQDRFINIKNIHNRVVQSEDHISIALSSLYFHCLFIAFVHEFNLLAGASSWRAPTYSPR